MTMTLHENEMFTRVGPKTPAGEMLRRYWQPVGFVKELKNRPKRRRLLGEDLVLFRDDQGRLGLLGLRCPHRGTSLEYGHLEDGGLRCCYHGWLFDVTGRCLEQPAEPPGSHFKDRIHHLAYEVQELGGVIFAYLGPKPAPLLPRYDVLVREDGVRSVWGRLVNCNYFQMVENTVDQNHLKWLHRTASTPDWDDGFIDPKRFDYGIFNTYTREVAGKKYAHRNFFVMPTMNKTGNVEEGHPARHAASDSGETMRWRVPVDDEHTMHITVRFVPVVDGKATSNEIMDDRAEKGIEPTEPGVYRWDDAAGWFARSDQDRCAQESQGAVFDRTEEHLGYSDRGVILLRQLYQEAIEATQKGEDPLGVIRVPSENELIRLKPTEDVIAV